MNSSYDRKTFGEDISFLKQHVHTIILENHEGAAIAIVPAWQGRTMTSTAQGHGGISYGWVNYDLIESGRIDPQVNLYGGEDRIWISPEGSQFSFFFRPGDPLLFSHWRCPSLVDTLPFSVIRSTHNTVDLCNQGTLTNYQGVPFEIRLERSVTLLERNDVENLLAVSCSPQLRMVAHESQNRLVNVGQSAWRSKTGLPSIWILCMNKPSSQATIVIPFQRGSESELGKIVTSDYFGPLDESRLKADSDRGLIYFLGDGRYRSKLGLSFKRSRPILGSWDEEIQALTVVQFNLPDSAPDGYASNLWKVLDNPYEGDVINSYNDGQNEGGGMLGPFYELETLSPALALKPGESYNHIHQTFHFEGDRSELSRLAEAIFGVTVDEIVSQFRN